MTPHAHCRSLPPGAGQGPFAVYGGLTSLETALREVA